MATKKELDNCYMSVAFAHAKLSKGIRAKVGAALVTESGVILAGYNGLAPSGSNELEYTTEDGQLITKPEVIHAELNCILKAAKEGVSILDSTIYITLSPCLVCSEMLVAAGVKRVVYYKEYKCTKGIDNLKKHDIIVERIPCFQEFI